MNIEQLYSYCLNKKKVTEHFPFDKSTLVFKVLGKMFVIVPLDKWEEEEPSITLKCDPDYTTELRDRYSCIYPGPYVSNKHWNTIDLYTGEISPKLICELIDHSYDMVIKGLPKKLRETL